MRGGGRGGQDAKQVGWKVDTGLEILTALDSDWSVLQDMCFLIGREADFGSCRLAAKMYYQNPDDGTHRMYSLNSAGWHLLEYLSKHYKVETKKMPTKKDLDSCSKQSISLKT